MSLSDKKMWTGDNSDVEVYPALFVKQFIKELKEECIDADKWKKADALAGEGLI